MATENRDFIPERVAVFSGNYNCCTDGHSRTINRLVAYLESRGTEVLVFSPRAPHPRPTLGGTLVPMPSAAIPGRTEYRFASWLTRSGKRRLKAFQPDLIHVSTPDLLGYSALRYAEGHHIPVVASFHTRFDTYFRYYGLKSLEGACRRYLQHFYAHCEHVYVPSPSMKEVLASARIGRDVRIWSRGIDRTMFTPDRRDLGWRRSIGIGDDEIVLLFVGRLVKEKAIGVVAELHDALKARDVPHRVMIVGDGPARPQFEARMPEGIFTGFFNGPDLARAYASSDIFFNPSQTETFGNVTLEAMAAGLPTVCLRATGSSNLVDDGTSGYLVEPGDIGQAADRVEALIAEPALRRTMSLAARKRSAAYSWDAVMDELVGHYRDIMKARRAQRIFGYARFPATQAVLD
jgi:glycosyltransferase involved in cell wall biosynthesis